MADYTINDLTTNGTYDAGIYIETWKSGWTESKKSLITTLTSDEAADRISADEDIIDGLGTNSDGTYSTDETTNYLQAADFAAETLTPNLYNADKLLDLQIKDIADTVAGFGSSFVALAVKVSAAEMKALKFIQKQLIAAPGSGKFIQLIHCCAYLNYGTAAFSFGYGLDVSYDDTIDPPNAKIGSFTQAFAEATADSFEVMSNVGTAITWFQNSAIVLACEDTSSVGDSDLEVFLVYKIITI